MKSLFYKIVVIITLMVMLILTGCSMTDQQDVKSSVQNAIDLPEVQSIRNMTTDGIKLGDLIDAGMGSPTYELYNPAEDGNTYVTIKGNMLYKDVPVVVTIQYKKVSETEYEYYTLTTNDIPVDAIEATQFFDYFKSEYEKKKQTKTEAIAASPSESSNTSIAQRNDNNSKEVPNENKIGIEENELFELFKMIKENILYIYGNECEIRPTGGEGSSEGYYFRNLGVTIVFDSENDVSLVSYIYCDETVDIEGAKAGMNFKQIQEKLGNAEIVENSGELPEFKIYEITYIIRGYKVRFSSFDREGSNSTVTILRQQN